jgi:small-conductance mechanosensitive channel
MIEDVMQRQFLNNNILQYLVFLLTLLLVYIALFIVRKVIINKVVKKRNIKPDSDEKTIVLLIESKTIPIIYCIAVYLSIKILYFNPEIEKILRIAFLVGVLFFSIRLVLFITVTILEKRARNDSTTVSKKRTIRIISFLIKAIVWSIAGFVLLDNLGINITTLIAGLGIGGIAIALAAQTVLGDLFSCFVIYLDRPFEIGDYINIDTFSGTIEHIGIKTTRIRSLSGEQLVFSNTDLTTSRLRNYKRMEKRRINFKIAIVYETKTDLLENVPGMIAEIIQSIEDTSYERAHFSAFSDFGLIIEVVYYVNTSDYIRYMDIQQEINIGIMKVFEANRIRFAYPTQSIYLEDAKNKKA